MHSPWAECCGGRAGRSEDGHVIRIKTGENKNRLGFFPPKKAGEFRFILDSCPLEHATPEDWDIIEAGQMHAADPRTLDIERSSENMVRLVLLVSQMASKMGMLGGLV